MEMVAVGCGHLTLDSPQRRLADSSFVKGAAVLSLGARNVEVAAGLEASPDAGFTFAADTRRPARQDSQHLRVALIRSGIRLLTFVDEELRGIAIQPRDQGHIW
jgi:hypothetical protein